MRIGRGTIVHHLGSMIPVGAPTYCKVIIVIFSKLVLKLVCVHCPVELARLDNVYILSVETTQVSKNCKQAEAEPGWDNKLWISQ